MTIDKIYDSIALKKRFCKDSNLPIAVFDNPYFIRRLTTLNHVTGDACQRFKVFCRDLERFDSEQDYFECYNNIKEKVINDIKNNPEFVRFNNEQVEQEKYLCGRKNLYSEENDGKIFISLDMKKANFSALHHWNPQIFNGCQTWEAFLGQYTDLGHIIQSKYIRQVIMGACNPKRQTRYEHQLMNSLAKHYVMPRLDEDLELMSLSEDEILIKVLSCPFETMDVLNLIAKAVGLVKKSEIEHIIKISVFQLKKIKGTDGWIRHNYAGRDEFKCLNAELYHQVILHYLGHEIINSDLVFYHNGQLARFLKPIENPFEPVG